MANETPAAGARASAHVSEKRLWQRHMDMAKFGATPKGGVNRQALSEEDIEARRLFLAWARERGFRCSMDVIGNTFVRRPGTDADAPPVISGSHIDSQPTGGRFDGIYGVLAAFEALEAIEEAGITTRRPIEATVWTNEEGSRFEPGCMGSIAFTKPERLQTCSGSRTLKARASARRWRGSTERSPTSSRTSSTRRCTPSSRRISSRVPCSRTRARPSASSPASGHPAFPRRDRGRERARRDHAPGAAQGRAVGRRRHGEGARGAVPRRPRGHHPVHHRAFSSSPRTRRRWCPGTSYSPSTSASPTRR